MIKGYVNEALEPVVEIGLKRGDDVIPVPAVIDTGFSGQLCLAERHVEHVKMSFEFAEPYELANGEVAVMDVFRATIMFGRRTHVVNLILTSSQDTLIGASLLKGFKLTIDYPGRVVEVERPI